MLTVIWIKLWYCLHASSHLNTSPTQVKMPATFSDCIFILSLVNSIVLSTSHKPEQIRAETENLTVTCNPEFIDVRTVVHTDRHPHEVDIVFNVVQNIDRTLYIQAIIYKHMVGSWPRQLIKGKWLKFCDFLAKPQVDMFMHGFINQIKRHSNRLLECPIHRVSGCTLYAFNRVDFYGNDVMLRFQMEYNVTGMLVDSSFVPSFVPDGRYMAKISMAFKKTGNKVGYEPLFVLVWTGELQHTWFTDAQSTVWPEIYTSLKIINCY